MSVNVFGLDDPEAAELVTAWARWEDEPGREGPALRMEHACAAVSVRLGVSVNDLRIRLAEHRRSGVGPAEAVLRVLGDPEDRP